VQKFTTKNDNSKYINKIEIGYQKWESENIGGIDEVCTRHEYATEINSAKSAMSLLSRYSASGYAIEWTRRKWFYEEPTTDWRYDNDNFIISTKDTYYGPSIFKNSSLILGGIQSNIQSGDTLTVTGSASNDGTYTVSSVAISGNSTVITLTTSVVTEVGTYIDVIDSENPFFVSELYRHSFSYGAGMLALQTAFNLRLTPKRMLLSHLNKITAGLQIINGNISFVKGEGNTALECSASVAAYTDGCQEEYKSQQLKENQDIAWNDTNALNIAPIYLPET
jgi:hypothetical protein